MDEKPPVGAPDDDTYVIDDTGDLQEVGQKLIDEALGGSEPAAAAPAANAGELAALRTENQKLRDQYLRARADFENFRKRAEREKTDFQKYAIASAIRDLLPVVDNLERALLHTPDASEEFHKGIELIYKQFMEQLQRWGVKMVGDVSEPFNPNLHEAVMREENPSVPANTITEVFQKGYMLHDRLLRPAMVKVAVGGRSNGETT